MRDQCHWRHRRPQLHRNNAVAGAYRALWVMDEEAVVDGVKKETLAFVKKSKQIEEEHTYKRNTCYVTQIGAPWSLCC